MIRYRKHSLFPTGRNLAPAIFLHGFLGSSSMWDKVFHHLRINRFEDEVFTGTLPGHGKGDSASISDLPKQLNYRNLVEMATEQLPTGKYSIVAYSMGARLALAMILAKPELFRSAVLVGVSPGISGVEERLERKSWDDAQADAIVRNGMDEFVSQWETLPLFASQASLKKETLDAQRAVRSSHHPEGAAFAMRNLGVGNMPSLWELLPYLAVPTRVVTGSRDAKFCEIARKMCVASKRITHLTIDGAGHNVVLEQPEAFAASFSEFI